MARTRGGNRDGVVDLLVEFGPALHPAATALDVFVTGPCHQVRATVPLRWAGGATPGGQPGVPGGVPYSPPATGPGE